MTKIYFFIGLGLVIVWIGTWFLVRGMFKALDKGENSKFLKLFVPKDFERNLEMIERQAQRKKREEEKARKALEEEKIREAETLDSPEENTEDVHENTEE